MSGVMRLTGENCSGGHFINGRTIGWWQYCCCSDPAAAAQNPISGGRGFVWWLEALEMESERLSGVRERDAVLLSLIRDLVLFCDRETQSRRRGAGLFSPTSSTSNMWRRTDGAARRPYQFSFSGGLRPPSFFGSAVCKPPLLGLQRGSWRITLLTSSVCCRGRKFCVSSRHGNSRSPKRRG